jgi:hypothetical protein
MEYCFAIAWNGSIWVAGGAATNGTSNSLAYSTNGISWTGLGNSLFTSVYSICWNGRFFTAVGYGSNHIATSADGIDWTGRGPIFGTNTLGNSGRGVAAGPNLVIAVGLGDTNNLYFSQDGVVWYGRSPFDNFGNGIAYNGKYFVGVGDNSGTIIKWVDGQSTVTESYSFFGNQAKAVAWNGSMWIAVGGGSHTIAYSYDGETWVGDGGTTFPGGDGRSITWNGNYWVAIGSTSNYTAAESIKVSVDGSNWTDVGNSNIHSPSGEGGPQCVASRSIGPWMSETPYPEAETITDQFCILLYSGYPYYSYDGLKWNGNKNSNYNQYPLDGVAWNGTYWLGTSYDGNGVYLSSDGITWKLYDSPFYTYYQNHTPVWGGNKWVVSGFSNENGLAAQYVYYSENGYEWQKAKKFPEFAILPISFAWNGSYFLSVERIYNSTRSKISRSFDGKLWSEVPDPGTQMYYLGKPVWNGSYWLISSYDDGTESGISTFWQSRDGYTWINTLNLNPAGTSFSNSVLNGRDIAWNGSVWVSSLPAGHGYYPFIYSYDGSTWYESQDLSGYDPRGGLAWNGKYFVATVEQPITFLFFSAYSSDGKSWLLGEGRGDTFSGPIVSRTVLPYVPTALRPSEVTALTEQFTVAFGTPTYGGFNKLGYSYDGIHWNNMQLPSNIVQNTSYITNIAWNGKQYIIPGNFSNTSTSTSSPFIISTDGINWATSSSNIGDIQGIGVAWGSDKWVLVTTSIYGFYYSYDGVSWINTGFTNSNTGADYVEWNGQMFLAGINGTVFSSYDGISWTNRRPINPTGTGSESDITITYSVKWQGEYWLMTGEDSNGYLGFAKSYDGYSWMSNTPPSPTSGFTRADWNGTRWISYNVNGLITSTNGETWTETGANLTSLIGPGLIHQQKSISWNGKYWFSQLQDASGIRYDIYSIEDGDTWTIAKKYTSYTTTYYEQIIHNGHACRFRPPIDTKPRPEVQAWGGQARYDWPANNTVTLNTSNDLVIGTYKYSIGGNSPQIPLLKFGAYFPVLTGDDTDIIINFDGNYYRGGGLKLLSNGQLAVYLQGTGYSNFSYTANDYITVYVHDQEISKVYIGNQLIASNVVMSDGWGSSPQHILIGNTNTTSFSNGPYTFRNLQLTPVEGVPVLEHTLSNQGSNYFVVSNNTLPANSVFLDRSASSNTYTSGATIDFSNFSGFVLTNNVDTTGVVGMWLCGGGSTSNIGMSGITGQFGTIYYNSGIDGYTWSNDVGSSITMSFTAIKTRNGA